jgi:hypothetical protein
MAIKEVLRIWEGSIKEELIHNKDIQIKGSDPITN